MALITTENIVFERANNAQITKHYENIAQAFAAPLSQAGYLDFQHKLADTIASKSNTEYWVLRRSSDPLALISSCTIYLRSAVVASGQGSRPSTCAVVTDLFTHPEHRMRGMAKLLLHKLQFELDEDDRVEFSVLYSDIHTDMYESLGWKPLPAAQLRIYLGKMKLEERSPVDGATFLTFRDVLELAETDVNTSKLRLSGHRDGRTHIQLLPTDPLMRWHLIRSKLLSQHLSKRTLGSQLQGAQSHGRYPAYTWWSHDFRTRRLNVCRLFVTRHKGLEDGVQAVLEAAVVEAAFCGLREVVVWDPSGQVVRAAEKLMAKTDGLSMSNGERMEMIPCLRWKGGEAREVAWEQNEFYGWS